MRNASFQPVHALRASPEEAHRSSFAPLNERRFSIALAGVARQGAPATIRGAGRDAS